MRKIKLANVGRLAWSLGFVSSIAAAQQGAQNGDWPEYGADKGHTKYSTLNQITLENVADLELAWRWTPPDEALIESDKLPLGAFKGTPIEVDGVLYLSTRASQICAVDAATGETKWVYDPESWKTGRPTNSGFQHRGVTYWKDGDDARIYIATGDRRLVAVDAETGTPVAAFGDNGVVALTDGFDDDDDLRHVGHNAPVTICRDTIVVGSIIFDGPTQKEMPPGNVRGYDVRTGAFKWVFRTIPDEGQFGNETWKAESWRYSGNTNAWSMIAADDELGYVYVPLGTPTNDWYGGHRLGDNLFAESLLCLDAQTGERVWHFQMVHHGLWDYDLPAAPVLCDIDVDGKPMRAVAQVSKQGFTYVFDRVTGEPIWPIEERPVPQSDVPGEQTAPTQPFPTKPPAFERQGLTVDDLIDFTPELRAKAEEIVGRFHFGPIFTPPVVSERDRVGTIQMPGAGGGANWWGASFDPQTGRLFVPSNTMPSVTGLRAPDKARSNFDFVHNGNFMLPTVDGLPVVKPPWGRITAIDLNEGDIAWQVANAPGPKDKPALAGVENLPDLGWNTAHYVSSGGICSSKTLVFVSQVPRDAGQVVEQETKLRAFDPATGERVWEFHLEQAPHGAPMTYLAGGRQFLCVATGGNGEPAELIALALPPTHPDIGEPVAEAATADTPTARLLAELERFQELSGGTLGVAAVHLDNGDGVYLNADEPFPLASTYKVPIAMQLLHRVDEGEISLDDMIDFQPGDYSPGSGTIAKLFDDPGLSISLRNLLELMLLISDNSATDVCLKTAGGGEAVTQRMTDLGLNGIRVDRPTLLLIAEYMGIYDLPADRERAVVEYEQRAETLTDEDRAAARASFDKDGRDTATPRDMAALLQKIWRDEGLSKESAALLRDVMSRCETGQARIQGMLPPDTPVANKTGTIGGTTNDLGVVTLPANAGEVVMVLFVKASEKDVEEREEAIAHAARAVYDYFLFQQD
ncbi:MAG: class A beta-lactamase [Candidatus Hydrogenedentales bacterium]